MERLTITRPASAESKKCLPDGDGLPSWDKLPLYAKFPMVSNPRGSLTLCTTMLCEPKHRSLDFEFDLTDPYCHVISNEYQPLHDPHLRHHFSHPKMRRHLQRNGFITEEGKVICNLKEFNQYRQYLRKIYLLETSRELKLEENSRRSCKSEGSGTDVKSKIDAHGEEVRARLRQAREDAKIRIEMDIFDKSERLRRRLDEIKHQNALRENRRKLENQKKLQFLQQHQSEIQRKNRLLMRRWRARERERLARVEEQRRERVRQHQQRSAEAWEVRKTMQRERMEREEAAWQRQEERRKQSQIERERVIERQRQRLKDSLDRLREQARREYLENEEKHAKRLARRLALANLRNKRRRSSRYMHDRRYYRSLWSLEESLRRLTLNDIAFPGKRSSLRFLEMLNEAIDEAVDIMADEQMEMETEEEEVRLRAQQIVDYVVTKVQAEVYPLYLRMREEEDREVRFRQENSIIPAEDRSADRSDLRPVQDHVLTPAASPYTISKSTELSSVELKAKLLENLLTRLIDDLDCNRLSQDELLRLTKCVTALILSGKEDRTLEITDSLVKFTLEKILNDLKSGSIPQEEITGLTMTIIGREGSEEESMLSISSNDTQLQQYIEDTLQAIVQEEDLKVESPVNDAMLDEWIVSQLQEITDDVAKGRLSKEMISQMVGYVSEEIEEPQKVADTDVSLRQFLEKLINDLNMETGHSLYKIVHAVLSSYHTYKTKSMSEFVDILEVLVRRVQTQIKRGCLLESEVDIHKLNNLVKNLSGAVLSQEEIRTYANNILSADEEDKSPSTTNSVVVEQVLQDARERIERASIDRLKMFANVVTSSCEELVASPEEGEEQPFVQHVSDFIVEILRLAWKSVRHGGFSDKDLVEMTQIFNKAMETSNFLPETGLDRSEILMKHIDEVLRALESGKVSEQELSSIGKSLVTCGNRLISKDSSEPQQGSSSGPRLTSTAIADDVVNHLLNTLQSEVQRGEMTKDSIKQLALCILNSKTSEESVDTVIESVSKQKHTSPCDSQLAEDFVQFTIADIVRDLESRSLYGDEMSSMALSIASALSTTPSEGNARKFEATVEEIIRVLKQDEVPPYDIKKVFALIMEHYASQMFQEPFPDSKAETSDSLLAESLIRETLNKVERDIKSGQLSSEDVKSMMDETMEISMSQFKTPGDVVNLTLAILQQLVFDLSASKIPLDDVMNFLKSVDNTTQHQSDLSEIRGQIKKIMGDIREKRSKSEFLKNIIRNFLSSEKSSLRNVPKDKNPVNVLHHVLENIHSDILTNFVRMTVGSVMQELSARSKQDKRKTIRHEEKTEFDLQTASSEIANRVVTNLVQKIEHAIETGADITSEHVLSTPPGENHGWSRQSLETIPSKEIGILILDTLNNIVSNMRLEKSIVKEQKSEDLRDSKEVQSQMIQDFVLEKLQEIVESMQDVINFEETLPPTSTDVELEKKESEPSSIEGLDNKSARKLVSESLKSVVSEIKVEKERAITEMSHQTTSTVSLEAEAIVVEALHGIIAECEQEDLQVRDDLMKKHLLRSVEGIMKDLKEQDQPECRHAIEQLFEQSFSKELKKSETELGDFIESTMKTIVGGIENDEIKANEVFRLAKSSSDVQGSPSLEDMTQLTAQVLKTYDESAGVRAAKSDQQQLETEVVAKVSSQLGEIAKELVRQTIANIEERVLTDEEMIDLASAITTRQPELEEVVDNDVEQFVCHILEKELEILNSEGLDPESAAQLTTKLSQAGTMKSYKDESTTSISSSEIAALVKGVLSKIAQSLSPSEAKDGNKRAQSNPSASSISASSKPLQSGSDAGSKVNINPNAMKKQLSSKSLQSLKGPSKKTAPVAIVHSATNVVKPKSKEVQTRKLLNRNTIHTSSANHSPAGHTYYRLKDNLNDARKSSPIKAQQTPSSKPNVLPQPKLSGPITPPKPHYTRSLPQKQMLTPTLTKPPSQQKPPLTAPSVNMGRSRRELKKASGVSTSMSSTVPKHTGKNNEKRSLYCRTASPTCRLGIPPIDVEELDVPEQIKSLCGSHRLRVKAVKREEKL